MKRTSVALLLVCAGLTACRATGPGSLDVHEAVLYGAAQEHVVWIYGGSDAARPSITIGGQQVSLGEPPATGAVRGTLGVDGRATFRVASRPATVAFRAMPAADGGVQVTASDPSVLAVYATDGAQWSKLSGTGGTVTAAPATTLRGAGNLTDAEADAVGTALLGQGPLYVAVLAEGSLPDAPLTVEPAPREYRRTGLYVTAPSTTAAGGTIPTAAPSTPGGRVTHTVIGSGTNAAVTAATVQVATTAAQVATLYAQAYGRQTGAPAPVTAQGTTTVGIFLGQRPTGGYSVRVVGTSVAEGVLTVTVQVRAPGAGTITTQALTSPWTLIQVPGTYSQVRVVNEAGQPLPQGGGTDR